MRVARGVVLAALLGVLAAYATGVAADVGRAIGYAYELDYGEGIVWQQAALLFTPRAYSADPGLPFIVFHYPPLYHLAVRAMRAGVPDYLAAGRVVSAASAVAIAGLVGTLVALGLRREGARLTRGELGIAVAAGLLALSLHAVRSWAMMMRVDLLAVALGLAGVLVAAWGDGRRGWLACALLLCTASVFTKQTQLPAGIAVFAVSLWRDPRGALAAAAIAGAVGLGCVAALQWATGGGFLANIIGYNINRYAWSNAIGVFAPEHNSLPAIGVMLIAARALLGPLIVARARPVGRAGWTVALVLAHAVLAALMLVTVFKSGGSFNYLLDFLCVGCVVAGIALGRWYVAGPVDFVLLSGLLMVGVLVGPYRQIPPGVLAAHAPAEATLVERIARADRPVASEDMVLLMRAGKGVVYEPAIVTELATVGLWDEAPLVAMIRARGFAFMITDDAPPGATDRRTLAVDTAMRVAYPRVEAFGGVVIREPGG